MCFSTFNFITTFGEIGEKSGFSPAKNTIIERFFYDGYRPRTCLFHIRDASQYFGVAAQSQFYFWNQFWWLKIVHFQSGPKRPGADSPNELKAHLYRRKTCLWWVWGHPQCTNYWLTSTRSIVPSLDLVERFRMRCSVKWIRQCFYIRFALKSIKNSDTLRQPALIYESILSYQCVNRSLSGSRHYARAVLQSISQKLTTHSSCFLSLAWNAICSKI